MIYIINSLFNSILELTNFLWGIPLLLAITLTGLYFGIKLHFIPVFRAFSLFRKKENIQNNEGEMSLFQCLAIAMSGTIGSGNIVGVATAIAIGGPGTLFWIWIVSLICMILKMVEVTMAVAYRIPDTKGNFWGGPMFYISKGIKNPKGKILGKVYAIALLCLVITDACFVQANTFATTLFEVCNIPMLISGTVWIFLGIITLKFGKTQKIGRVCEIISPLMCITYAISAIIVVLCNLNKIPLVLNEVFKYAFQPTPIMGVFSGTTLKITISKGFSRGIFSNEAGQGTSTTIYAKAKTNNPIETGLYSIIEVVADSCVCTLTALTILVTFVWQKGFNGIALNLAAFQSVLGKSGEYIVCLTMAFFTFSSYISFFIEYCTCLKYLFSKKIGEIITWCYFIPPIISIILPIYIIWSLADIAVGFIVFPNLIALLILRKKFFSLWKNYISRQQ